MTDTSSDASAADPVLVVAAAWVRDGAVLVAHRVTPPGWEFPGGKVEDGESEQDALTREIREELGVDVQVRARLGEATSEDLVLVLYRVRGAAEPRAGADHDELRWLTASELGSVDWLPLDQVLLPSVLSQLD